MEERFFTWCLFIAIWLIVLSGVLYLIEIQLGLSGWRRFVAMLPLLILLRMTIQRFLTKGKRWF